MPRRVDRSVLVGFFAEVRGYLPRIAEGLDALEKDPAAGEALVEVHRLLHSIKGTASMIGLGEISQTAGRAEGRVDEALKGDRPLDPRSRSALRTTLGQLEELLALAEADRSIGDISAPTDAEEMAPASLSDDPELAATVAEEFRGYLEQLGTRLRELDADRGRTDVLPDLWRPVHTIKGTAGIVGLSDVSESAHQMEDLLTQLGEGTRPLDDASLKQLFDETDRLAELIDGMAGDTRAAEPPPLAAPAADRAHAAELPPPHAESILRVRADRLDGVLQLLGDVTLQRAAFDRQVARLGEIQSELQLNLRRMARIADQIGSELDTGGLGASISAVPALAAAAEFDSLEMDRYTTLNRLARQLEEATSDSAAVGSGLEGLRREMEGFRGRLGLVTRDMQDRLAELRTVPFATLSDRLHRTVRVTAERRGKKAALEIVGEQVELDKDVIEEMAEPLLHLLRNAVDHGIEEPAIRRASGKSERGKIRIEVVNQGTEAMIRIDDDGAGLDAEALEDRATRLGTLSAPIGPAPGASLSAEERLERLIFERGLSTASEVSDVSGRGVGLDVVRASVDRLRGQIDVSSRPGEGVRFTIRLPGSQSILRVLLVVSRGEVLAVPLAMVDRVETLSASDRTTVDGVLTVTVAGESLRALDLGAAVGLPSGEEGAGRRSAILLDIADQRLALLADRILGVQEVVVRPLSDLFAERIYGMSGAALTGEGTVVLVLSPSDFLRAAPAPPPAGEVAQRERPLEVLIVDDSLSIRQILSRLMERNGWRALVARDGEEALEMLHLAPRPPDVAIVDLEMPRMDGFELTRTMQAHEIYRRVPIVILTTRAGDKHRMKAYKLGVTDYLVKPYREQILLAAIRDAVGHERERTL